MLVLFYPALRDKSKVSKGLVVQVRYKHILNLSARKVPSRFRNYSSNLKIYPF